jgi:hypothetical protein
VTNVAEVLEMLVGERCPVGESDLGFEVPNGPTKQQVLNDGQRLKSFADLQTRVLHESIIIIIVINMLMPAYQ